MPGLPTCPRWRFAAAIGAVLAAACLPPHRVTAADMNSPPDTQAVWQPVRERDGVRLDLRAVPGSAFKAARGEIVIRSGLARLIELLRDLDGCRNWMALCERARLVENLGEAEQYLLLLNRPPWPLPPHEVLVRVRWWPERDAGGDIAGLRVTASAAPERSALTPGMARLRVAYLQWQLRAQGNRTVRVGMQMHVEPGALAPAWMVNRMAPDIVYRSLANLRSAAQRAP